MSFARLRWLLSVILGAAAASAGCVTAPGGNPRARATDLDRTMVELRAQNAGYLRQVEELQNRVFILEDKLDSRRIAEGQRGVPVLPASRPIGPSPTAPEASLSAAEPPAEDDSTVEYAGEAALPPPPRDRGHGRARTVLRLAGNARPPVIALALRRPSPPLSASPSPLPAETAEPAEPIPAAEPLRLYRRSLEALHAGHHAAALAGFRTFLAQYPQHDYADNAQYWIGECYYDLSQFQGAAREFRRVVERYPRGNKVPDALLKLGFSELATGDRRDGRRVLESLRRSYPRHAASRLASERLAQADDRAPPPAITLEMPRR